MFLEIKGQRTPTVSRTNPLMTTRPTKELPQSNDFPMFEKPYNFNHVVCNRTLTCPFHSIRLIIPDLFPSNTYPQSRTEWGPLNSMFNEQEKEMQMHEESETDTVRCTTPHQYIPRLFISVSLMEKNGKSVAIADESSIVVTYLPLKSIHHCGANSTSELARMATTTETTTRMNKRGTNRVVHSLPNNRNQAVVRNKRRASLHDTRDHTPHPTRVNVERETIDLFFIRFPQPGTYTINCLDLLDCRRAEFRIFHAKFYPQLLLDFFGRCELPAPVVHALDLFTVQLSHNIPSISSSYCEVQFLMRPCSQVLQPWREVSNSQCVRLYQDCYEFCYRIRCKDNDPTLRPKPSGTLDKYNKDDQSLESDILCTQHSQICNYNSCENIRFTLNKEINFMHRLSLGIWFPWSTLTTSTSELCEPYWGFRMQLQDQAEFELGHGQWQWYDCDSEWSRNEVCVYCSEILKENTHYYVRIYCVKERDLGDTEAGQGHKSGMILLYDSMKHDITAHIPKMITESSEHIEILKHIQGHMLTFNSDSGLVSTLEVFLDGYFEWRSDLDEPSAYTFHMFGEAHLHQTERNKYILYCNGTDQISGDSFQQAIEIVADEERSNDDFCSGTMHTIIFNSKRMSSDVMTCHYSRVNQVLARIELTEQSLKLADTEIICLD